MHHAQLAKLYVQVYEECFQKNLIPNERQRWRTVQGIQRSSLACLQRFGSTSLPPVLCVSSLPPADISADADKGKRWQKEPSFQQRCDPADESVWKMCGRCHCLTQACEQLSLVSCHSFVKYIYPSFHPCSEDCWSRDKRDNCIWFWRSSPGTEVYMHQLFFALEAWIYGAELVQQL